ncbi:MAG: efflux RND transporter permease subunit [Candidatus Omnitrophica bacterium]|nr:efflux RND transporter permease subunit [Candidatus Omnitrophota bacterium]
MSLPAFSVRKPITVLMFALGIVILGAISWTRLSQELFPPIAYPQITIVTTYENAAPEEIEALITRAIEESVSAASGIRKVSSTSREGTSIVICEFDWNINIDFAALNVREKVDLVKEKLPRDAEDPIVMKFNPFDTPIMILSVSADPAMIPAAELREICRRIIKDEIEKIDGVAQVMLTGGREREILLEPSQPRLRAFSVSLLDIIELLKQENINYPAGTIETSFYEYLVRTIGEFKTVPEMHDVPLLITEKREEEQQRPELSEQELERKKRIIYLRDLGTVKDTLKDRNSISRYNGEDNISLLIQRQADANIIAVSKQIYERLKTLSETLPPELKIKVVYEQAAFIEQSIADLRDNAVQGGALAFIILLLFLRSAVSATVVTFSIPISLLLCLILMYFGKLSLNMMSLGGLALAVGNLVDNGIVIIENMFQHRARGSNPRQAAVEASEEVFSAILGSTLTSVAVFFPLVFVVGLAGQLFKQLALTVTFAQLASVLIAMCLTPLFMARVNAKQKKAETAVPDEQKIAALLEKQKRRSANPAVVYAAAVGIVAGVMLAAAFSVSVMTKMDREFLPKMDQRQFTIKLNMPAGTTLTATDAVVRRIEEMIFSFSAVKDATINIGSNKDEQLAGAVEVLGQNQANIIVNLKPKPARGLRDFFKPREPERPESIATSELVQQIKDRLKEVNLQKAELEYQLQESVLKSAFAGSAPLVVVLRGYDMESILIPAAKEVAKRISKIQGVYGVKDTLAPSSPEVKIEVRKDRASLYQLTVNQISATAQAAIKGYVATKFKEEGREIDVRVRLREEDRRDFNRIGKLFIFSPTGLTLFLEQVAYLRQGLGPTEIKREHKQRVIMVTANIYKRSLNDVVAETEEILAGIRGQLPQNYAVEIGGENKEMKDSFESLRFALILALVLVYMIMAAEFESLLQPFIIMCTVPLSIIGVCAALYITQTPLSVIVGLGFIMLGGIVVNNGILLIDFINLARKQGLSIVDAAIQAARVRFRPILMTALTTIVGLAPLAFALGEGAELRAPMARTVMGGLMSAMVLTLLVIPSLYIIMETIREKIAALFKPLNKVELKNLMEAKSLTIEELAVPGVKKAPAPAAPAREAPAADTASASASSPPSDILFNKRQLDVLSYLKIHQKISRLEYVVKFKVPLPVAERELEILVQRKILKTKGEGAQKFFYLASETDDV